MPSTSYVTTCVNPWVEAPAGVADDFSMPTACLKFRNIYNSVSSAGGHVVTIVNPWAIASSTGVGTQFGSAGVFTAATTTLASYTDSQHPDITTINTNFDRFRTVSAGVKVYYTGAEQSTAGVITIVPIVSVIPSTTTMPTDAGVWGNMPGARTVACTAMTEPLCGAFHSFDRPRFHNGLDVSGNAWFPSFAIVGIGMLANTAVLRIELEVNLEVIPKLITSLNANSFQTFGHSDAAIAITRRLDSTRVGSLSQVTSLRSATLGSKSSKRQNTGRVQGYKRKRSGYAAKGTGIKRRRSRRKPMRRMRR